jgi:N-methylhydantoinase A/oxoprolinase/acetone carboxylase beta subunit
MLTLSQYRIGIDIGGTHTDAVLIDSQANILATVKTITTQNIEEGFEKALRKLLNETPINHTQISGIYLGTTLATNALLQQTDLYRVGVIRLAGHFPNSLPVGYAWPANLKKALGLWHMNVGGGFECDGTPLSPVTPTEIEKAIDQLLELGAESLAIIGVFSPLNSEHELEAKGLAQAYIGKKLPLSLSHEIGGIGFIERENSTILNAALKKVMATGFEKLESIKKNLGLVCPLWITQNNGSLIDLQQALDYPVLTISAGPTNSFMGGAKLAGLTDAIIVDIGGTSTDVGIVRQGYPRRRLNNSQIGGVTLNFSMPDVLSIALGGGSHVVHQDGQWSVGPLSCGRRIQQESCAFGGSLLTLTDVALVLHHLSIPETHLERIALSKNECQQVMQGVLLRLSNLFERIGGADECHLPIVIIGGGAALLPQNKHLYIRPDHAHVANAYGAVLAEIAATVDTVVSLKNRDQTLESLQEQAKKIAIQKGADSNSIQIVDQQIIPYHYVPNQMARIIVTASGKQKI